MRIEADAATSDGRPGPTTAPATDGARPPAGGAEGAGTPAVEVEGLGRRFGDVEAVSDLSFEVATGELFGLVGPDGAGKTTTLRMLAGVLRPTCGDARLGGDSVVADPEAVKRRIAYMPQRFGLYADLTVEENLRFYADLFELPRAVQERSLERLYAFSRLRPFRHRLAGDLSGGMKQKLGLSCALVHQPAVLLLDEPTFGVDPVSRRELWLIVHQRVASGMTAVVSTSYLDEAERFDRVLLLDHGRRIALGTPRELLAPLAGRMMAVRGGEPRRTRDAARSAAGRQAGILRSELFGDRVHLTLDRAGRDVAGIERALAAAGIVGVSVRPVEPSLEDAFVERTGASETAAGDGAGAQRATAERTAADPAPEDPATTDPAMMDGERRPPGREPS